MDLLVGVGADSRGWGDCDPVEHLKHQEVTKALAAPESLLHASFAMGGISLPE